MISEVLQVCRRQLRVFFLASLLVFLAWTAVFRFVLADDFPNLLLGIPISIVISGWFDAVVLGAIKLDREGHTGVSIAAIMRVVRARLVPLILAGLIPTMALVVLGGLFFAAGALILVIFASGIPTVRTTAFLFFLTSIPGLFLTIRWALVAPAVLIENHGPLQCLGRSNELVKGNSWRVFLLLLFARVLGRMTAILGYTLSANLVTEVGIRLAFGVISTLGVVALAIMFFELRRLAEIRQEDELAYLQ